MNIEIPHKELLEDLLKEQFAESPGRLPWKFFSQVSPEAKREPYQP